MITDLNMINWEAATKKVQRFIRSNIHPFKRDDWEMKIYTWNQHPDDAVREKTIGLRVAEVDFCFGVPGMVGSGGSSYMQVDVPWGACVCLLVERLIIAYAEDWPKEDTEEEEQRLLFAFRG